MGSQLAIPDGLKSRRRLILFAIVGGLGFVVDQAIVYSIVELTDLTFTIAGENLTLQVAKVIAAETAIVVMFLINDFWTFRSFGGTGWRSKLRRLAKSNLVRIGGITVAVVVLTVLYEQFDIPLLLANAIGILCGFLVNYTFESLFTWKIGR